MPVYFKMAVRSAKAKNSLEYSCTQQHICCRPVSSLFVFSVTAALSLSLLLLFSYYGLTVWFPDMIKYLQKQEYASRTRVFVKEKVEHVTFNFTLENQVHRQGEYFNDKWVRCILSACRRQTHFQISYTMDRDILIQGYPTIFKFYIPSVLSKWKKVKTLWWMTTKQMKIGMKLQWTFYSEHCFDRIIALQTCSCLTSLTLMFPLTLPFQTELCMWFQSLKFKQ